MNIDALSDKLTKTVNHLRDEYVGIRAGHVSPPLVERIIVETYGTQSPLLQLSSIHSQDASTLIIQPWDKNIIRDIEKAIQKSDLGVSPIVDGAAIRLSFPPLSEERREEYVRLVHEKAEEAKMSGKHLREEFLKDVKAADLSEDEEKRAREQVQKAIDAFHATLKGMVDQKTQELRTV